MCIPEPSWEESVKNVKQGFSGDQQKAATSLTVLFTGHLDQNHLSDVLQRSILDPTLTSRVRIYLRVTMQFGILTCLLHYSLSTLAAYTHAKVETY